MNLPPSGKSGKKGQHGGGSSSSRARNVSHVTNKDSDKDVSSTAKKVKKGGGDSPKKLNEKKKPPVIIKSGTTSSMNVQDGPRSRVVISSQDQARKGTAGNNPNEPPTSELYVSGSEAENPRVSI